MHWDISFDRFMKQNMAKFSTMIFLRFFLFRWTKPRARVQDSIEWL